MLRGGKETFQSVQCHLKKNESTNLKERRCKDKKRKIMSLQSSTNDQLNQSSDVNEDEEDETDFSFNGSVNKEEAGAIINMIQNSPTKKRKTEKALFDSLQEYCADFRQ